MASPKEKRIKKIEDMLSTLRKNPKKSQTDENIIEKVEQDIRRGIEMAFNWFKKK